MHGASPGIAGFGTEGKNAMTPKLLIHKLENQGTYKANHGYEKICTEGRKDGGQSKASTKYLTQKH